MIGKERQGVDDFPKKLLLKWTTLMFEAARGIGFYVNVDKESLCVLIKKASFPHYITNL